MPRDKTANHRKLMSAAREEFLAFGFEKASMRSIGQRCGMTAAGIYRHCRSKEDLFDQLVSPAAERLGDWMREHVARYTDGFRDGQAAMWQDSWTDMMRDVVYPHMEDYYLLAGRSQGTKYASILHDLTEEAQTRFMSCIRSVKQHSADFDGLLNGMVNNALCNIRKDLPRKCEGRSANHDTESRGAKLGPMHCMALRRL